MVNFLGSANDECNGAGRQNIGASHTPPRPAKEILHVALPIGPFEHYALDCDGVCVSKETKKHICPFMTP
jgi:hypothetical protein